MKRNKIVVCPFIISVLSWFHADIISQEQVHVWVCCEILDCILVYAMEKSENQWIQLHRKELPHLIKLDVFLSLIRVEGSDKIGESNYSYIPRKLYFQLS